MMLSPSGTLGEVLPQLFGDEGHEGVEDTQDLVEEVQRLTAGRLIDRRAVGRLDELEVRGGEVVTDELVDEGSALR